MWFSVDDAWINQDAAWCRHDIERRWQRHPQFVRGGKNMFSIVRRQANARTGISSSPVLNYTAQHLFLMERSDAKSRTSFSVHAVQPWSTTGPPSGPVFTDSGSACPEERRECHWCLFWAVPEDKCFLQKQRNVHYCKNYIPQLGTCGQGTTLKRSRSAHFSVHFSLL